MKTKMENELIQSLREAVTYAKGDKSKGYETIIEVPAKIPETFDVQSLRKDLHMSQVEFASRFGFNVDTLRNWEHGRRQPESCPSLSVCYC